jgi:hypothetical protein
VIRDLWLQKIISLYQFIADARRTPKHKTIIITAGQAAKQFLFQPQIGNLGQLGLKQIAGWKNNPFSISYVAVVKDGRLIYERSSEADLVYKDARLRVNVGKNQCLILVDWVDYAKSKNGLNIVVLDGQDVQSHFCRSQAAGPLLVEQ